MDVFAVAFALTTFLVLIGEKFFRRLEILDSPEIFGHRRPPVPYGLGIIFWIVFFVSTLLFIPLSFQIIVLLAAGFLITAISFLDDQIKISAFLRLAVQLLVAFFVVLAGVKVPAITNPFGSPFVLDGLSWTFGNFTIEPLAALIAILWIVFVMNAINWLDGVSGIVNGVTAIGSFVIYILASFKEIHVIDQSTLSLMALIIAGASLAFLIFDFPKPLVLMGDSGTMFLGFMLAVMAIFSGGKFATVFIVLAIPLFDAIWTIGRRLRQKKSPLKGDFQHFHHDLLRSGFSERQVNLFYFCISLLFGISALYLESLGKLLALILLFMILTLVRFLLNASVSKSFSHPDP